MSRTRRNHTYAIAALCSPMIVAAAGCSTKVSAPPEPPVAVRLGDAAFEAQNYESAIRDYRLYLADVDRGEYTARAFYKTALASQKLGDHSGALATLAELERRYPDSVWVQVEALRGDAERDIGRPTAAVLAWDRGWPVADEIERPKLRNRIEIVATGLSREEIEELKDEVSSGAIEALLAEELASRSPLPIQEPVPAVDVEEVDAERPPATVLGALRALDVGRGTAATPTYSDGESVQRGPTQRPLWRGEDPAAAPAEAEQPAVDEVREAAPSDEVVVLGAAEGDDSDPAPVAPPMPAKSTDVAVADRDEASDTSRGDELAGLVKLERPLGTQPAVPSYQEPSASSAPVSDSGPARLQKIDFSTGAPVVEEPAPRLDSLEKLDVPGTSAP